MNRTFLASGAAGAIPLSVLTSSAQAFEASTFNHDLARTLLEICRFTYADGASGPDNAADRRDALGWLNNSSNPKPIGNPLGTPLTLRGQNDETSVASIVRYPDHNVVSYMGTLTEFRQKGVGLQAVVEFVESLQDWTDNAKIKPVAFLLNGAELGTPEMPENAASLEGLVHKGFLEQLHAIQGQIVTDLLSLGGRAKPVIVTGHSQGGAEATLATAAFVRAGFKVAATYTFAAPRSGDLKFKESIQTPFFRIEYGNDIVPHLPPVAIRQGLITLLDNPFLDHFSVLRDQLKELQDFGYQAVGPLHYGATEADSANAGLNSDQEQALFNTRLKQLLRRPKDWGDHHHLAGTFAETNASPAKRGNYTAIIGTHST